MARMASIPPPGRLANGAMLAQLPETSPNSPVRKLCDKAGAASGPYEMLPLLPGGWRGWSTIWLGAGAGLGTMNQSSPTVIPTGVCGSSPAATRAMKRRRGKKAHHCPSYHRPSADWPSRNQVDDFASHQGSVEAGDGAAEVARFARAHCVRLAHQLAGEGEGPGAAGGCLVWDARARPGEVHGDSATPRLLGSMAALASR